MTTQNSTELQATLNDDQIVEIARKIDAFIMQIGEEYSPTGIEFAAIMLGRLMIFTKHTECFHTFSQMMEEIGKMKEPEPLFKTADLKENG